MRLEGMRLIRRSLAEHMEDGDGAFAPRCLESEIVSIDVAGECHGGYVQRRRGSTENCQDVLVNRMVDKWEVEGRPKTIVKVPNLRHPTRTLVTKIRKAFEKRGAEVLDGTGNGKIKQQEFIRALQRDRKVSYSDTHDLIIGIERVKEGTDWPVCSHVFVVGMPKSLQLVIQLIGRAMRKKHDTYPGPHRDVAKAVFFVLVNGGNVLNSLSLDHSRHSLYLATFMADAQVGQQWLLDREIQRGITEGLSDSSCGKSEVAKAKGKATEPISHQTRSIVSLVAAQIAVINRDKGQLRLGN